MFRIISQKPRKVYELNMTLYQLGKEYLTQANRIIKKVQILNNESKQLEGNRLLEMKRRIYSLYSDAIELKQTAHKLMNYYEGDIYNG